MKLATLKDGTRDGQLVVVSRDLATAHFASHAASRLQQALDDWNFVAPQLEDLYATLNGGKARHAFAFDPLQCMAPLPRAAQWVVGSTMADPGAGGALPMHRGGADQFLGATGDVRFVDAAWGISCDAAVAVITGDLALGADADSALESVRLLALAADWSLRALLADGTATGALQGKPAASFAPLAVTADELGGAWRGGRLRGTLALQRAGRRDAGEVASAHFGQLIAQLARTRAVGAGSIVGCNLVLPGAPAADLQFGDRVHIDFSGKEGQTVFGAIDQRVAAPA